MEAAAAICGASAHRSSAPFFERFLASFDDFRVIVEAKILVAREHDHFLVVHFYAGAALVVQYVVPEFVALAKACVIVVHAAF